MIHYNCNNKFSSILNGDNLSDKKDKPLWWRKQSALNHIVLNQLLFVVAMSLIPANKAPAVIKIQFCPLSVSAEWMIRLSHETTVLWRAQGQTKLANTSNYSVPGCMLSIWKASYGCMPIAPDTTFTLQAKKRFLNWCHLSGQMSHRVIWFVNTESLSVQSLSLQIQRI